MRGTAPKGQEPAKLEAAEFCGADGVVVTGSVTGVAPSEEDRRTVGQSLLPVFIGSGVTPDNVNLYRGVARGVIVGSYLKEDGHWQGNVCPQRAQAIRDALT